MATNEELIRYLTSSDYAESEGRGYYLHTKGGSLTEKYFDGAEWGLPVQIAETKGAATYVAGSPDRAVFTIDPTGALRNYIYDADQDSWEQGQVNSAGAHPHAQSNLTSAFAQGNSHVYFQDASQSLHEVNKGDGNTWSDGGALPAGKPTPGSALANITTGEDVIYLFYQHEDLSIHYLVKNHTEGTWTDKELPNGQVTGIITRFIASPSEKDGFDVYYLTKEGHIVNISSGERTEVGSLDAEGKFKASSSAECWRPRPWRRRGCWCCRCWFCRAW